MSGQVRLRAPRHARGAIRGGRAALSYVLGVSGLYRFVTLGGGGGAQKLVSGIYAKCRHDHQIGFALKKNDITLSGSCLPVSPHTHSAQQALPTPIFLRPRPTTLFMPASLQIPAR